MYYLGYDIGSSSIKAALVNGESGAVLRLVHHPETEMGMISVQAGWAEQDPEEWWENIVHATRKLLKDLPSGLSETIEGIGISYQMHGLVLVDSAAKLLRPSIIWCDSRAIAAGEELASKIGPEKCFTHLLNEPGNFTASKLRWVRDNEPEIFSNTDKMMLPGDYINLRLTGEINTTISGLSEGMLWDFHLQQPASMVLDEIGASDKILPQIADTFSIHGHVSSQAAEELGIPKGVPVCYRAGDQPNNAMSLGVLEPGEIAATGGTSGVVYGVQNKPVSDTRSRVNSFAHVNYSVDDPRIGVLLCINGAGSQYRWMKQMVAGEEISYNEMEVEAASIPMGSDGLRILPFGNGAERMLGNKDVGGRILNLDLNRHTRPHLYRAALEGVAYAFAYGMEILEELGLEVGTIKVGSDNLFRSEIFSSTVADLTGSRIEVIETTGAVGAASAVGYTLGHHKHLSTAIGDGEHVELFIPSQRSEIRDGYELWKEDLDRTLNEN